jgi:hypothetical protein
LLDITSQSALRENQRKVPSWLKKAAKLSWSGLGIPICLLKKINRHVDQILDQDIHAILPKTNLAQDIGPVRRGKMKVEEVLKLLEKHEDECNRRYAKIEKQLETLDLRLWGIAILIIGAAVVQKMF